MKIKISYCDIQSDHILAIPVETHSEIVEVKNRTDPALEKHILSKKDLTGYKFKKVNPKKQFGFDYVSMHGGVKLEVLHIKRL